MENVTVYEYLLDKDRIIEVEHVAKVQGDRYVLKAGKKENTHKILRKDELDDVINNHVFSLEDNFSKYEKLIIETMEKRYNEVENRQKKQKAIIAKLKEMCSSREENHGLQGTADRDD